jgi:hypothetical protein
MFHMIRSVGCVLDAYDLTYKEDAKCEAKARNALKAYEIDESAITELINTNFEFKKLWFKALFNYCCHLHEGVEQIYDDASVRSIRKIAEHSDIVSLGNNQTFDVEHGAFLFQGQLEFSNTTQVKGSFITKPGTVKSLAPNTVLLNIVPPNRRELSRLPEREYEKGPSQ